MAALSASQLLYAASGRQFTGRCEAVTIRPTARPYDQDARGWGRAFPGGWFSSWGTCSVGYVGTDTASHFGCSGPPEIELGAYPVTDIEQVLIDGDVIPADEYELQDWHILKRMRPTATSVPTERWGWPTCQLLDLPDTQPGTFSVTYRYGMAPPASGILACETLAAQLALKMAGSPNRLPDRLTSISRLGVSMQVVDVMSYLEGGYFGIVEVDLFIRAVNPGHANRRATVWSPDQPRARRNMPGIT